MLESGQESENVPPSNSAVIEGVQKRFFKVLWAKYAPNKKRKNKNFSDGFLTYVVARPFPVWPSSI